MNYEVAGQCRSRIHRNMAGIDLPSLCGDIPNFPVRSCCISPAIPLSKDEALIKESFTSFFGFRHLLHTSLPDRVCCTELLLDAHALGLDPMT